MRRDIDAHRRIGDDKARFGAVVVASNGTGRLVEVERVVGFIEAKRRSLISIIRVLEDEPAGLIQLGEIEINAPQPIAPADIARPLVAQDDVAHIHSIGRIPAVLLTVAGVLDVLRPPKLLAASAALLRCPIAILVIEKADRHPQC